MSAVSKFLLLIVAYSEHIVASIPLHPSYVDVGSIGCQLVELVHANTDSLEFRYAEDVEVSSRASVQVGLPLLSECGCKKIYSYDAIRSVSS